MDHKIIREKIKVLEQVVQTLEQEVVLFEKLGVKLTHIDGDGKKEISNDELIERRRKMISVQKMIIDWLQADLAS